jgi:flavodoxin
MMVKAVVIYDTFTGHTRSIAEKIKKRMEEIGMNVDLFRDKKFSAFASVREYQVIAIGSPCHGGRAARTLKRKINPIISMDLKGKKLITFASCVDAKEQQWVCDEIETILKPTGITPVASIGCVGKPPKDFDSAVEAAIQEEMFKF